MVGLNKPKLCTKFEDFSFSHYVNIEGERQIFGNSPSPRPRSPFFSACNFMMGLGKPQLRAKFKVASPSCCKNIIGEPKILGSSPSPRLNPRLDPMMGLGKPQLHAKFEAAL